MSKFKVSGRPAGGTLSQEVQRRLGKITVLRPGHEVAVTLRIKSRNQTQQSELEVTPVLFTNYLHTQMPERFKETNIYEMPVLCLYMYYSISRTTINRKNHTHLQMRKLTQRTLV